MVNEIHPRDKLIERAYKLADHIMTQPRTTRRMTTQVVRRPWRRQITDSLDGGFAMQMFATRPMLALIDKICTDQGSRYSPRELLGNSLYVRVVQG
jgi:hypothetical protein